MNNLQSIAETIAIFLNPSLTHVKIMKDAEVVIDQEITDSDNWFQISDSLDVNIDTDEFEVEACVYPVGDGETDTQTFAKIYKTYIV